MCQENVIDAAETYTAIAFYLLVLVAVLDLMLRN